MFAPSTRAERWPPTVAEALAVPPGAQWHRVALQVNPFDYDGNPRPKNLFPDEPTYNDAIVRACIDAGIDLIAITDHWCVRTADGLIRAAEDGGIVALPGFEAVSREGIHLLVLFERGTPYHLVDAVIGACGAEPGCPPGKPGNPYEDIARCATERKAVVIPAHVNGNKRLLTVLQGNALSGAWRDEHVHAVAVSPGQRIGPVDEQILRNALPEYARQHPLAVLHADDIKRSG